MSKVFFRLMRPADLDAVVDIEQKSFHTPWSRHAFEEELYTNELAYYFVMVEAENIPESRNEFIDKKFTDIHIKQTENDCGKVIAYAGIWIIIDEAHVTNVALLPEYRGQGYGRHLMLALLTKASELGANCMTLEVRPSNLAALQLYKSFGFVQKGLRPNYYTDTHEDALIMWLDEMPGKLQEKKQELLGREILA